MTKDNYQISKKRIAPFYILISIILMWFIGIQLFGPDERDAGAKPENIIYSGTFTWENQMAAVKKSLYPVIMMSRRKRG
nr:hypothetical protein [uncultured Dorea sp.]